MVLAGLVLGLSLGSGVALVVVAPPAVAQTPGSVDPSACVPGASIAADRPANGPSPVGHCDPSEKQRVIDTAVWFWVLALLVLVGAIGVVAFVRSVRRAPVDAQ